MAGQLLFFVILLLSFLVFFIPKPLKYYFSLGLLATSIILTSVWSLKVFSIDSNILVSNILPLIFRNSVTFVADRISAFFILVINITVFTGFLYARGYLRPYYERKSSLQLSIHFISYLWLFFSMIMVVMARDGLPFMVAWEIMAISSFLLVIFDAEDRTIMKSGISYLIQMHAGMFFIMFAFLIVFKATGEMSFDALKSYFTGHSNILLFLLFFVGFGTKAGFIPLHTWLPEAHPAAPSHVSGVMSGVMIKMGIYGILRVILQLQSDMLFIGVFILVISALSGILGVMMAIVQHDLKRLLAYHSIENIGIIGIGIGSGIMGLATGNNILFILGFTGGLLHILNHSLFKSLLFFNAGSVYASTHSRNIENMGGLIKKMPWTSSLFLLGSLAICGLPPLNGFISEFLIYLGMFKSLSAANLYQSVIILSAIVGLSLIGGLAIFCFTKAFGIVFLGSPRSGNSAEAGEVTSDMIVPQFIPVIFILLIGLGPGLFLKPISGVVSSSFSVPGVLPDAGVMMMNLTSISIISGIFILLTVFILVYRRLHLRSVKVSEGPTWGCGYTAGNARQQYTATSYAYNYNHIARPLINTVKHMDEIGESEIFPAKRTFHSSVTDFFKVFLIDKPVGLVSGALKKIAMMQTGRIQHYILYAFVFILIVLLLTFLKLI